MVDDDPTFRVLARRLLVVRGLTVLAEADSVASALATATRLEPSAALVDIGLPDGDGFTLARELAALPWGPRVVLTSVESDIGHPDAVRRCGAVTFVPKADLPNAPLVQLLGAD